jgi:rod shape-determining protein MreC
MIGQVTRVFPMQSEVTLLTDKDQAVPVEVVRTGLRSVVYGTAAGDTLELRFVPIGADVVAGDELVTSGLDGVYPEGLPVAKVVRVDKQADTAFSRVVCVPVAAVRGARDVLVLHYQSDLPPRPAEVEAASQAKDGKAKKGAKGAEKATEKAVKPEDKKATDKAASKSADKRAEKAANPAAGDNAHGAGVARAASGAQR